MNASVYTHAYRLYLQCTGCEFTVRQMQPYVVAVLINAAANPLGVDSFIFVLFYFFPFFSPLHFFFPSFCSPSGPPLFSFLFLSFFNFISEQQSDYADSQNLSLGLPKLGKTAGNARKSGRTVDRLKAKEVRVTLMIREKKKFSNYVGVIHFMTDKWIHLTQCRLHRSYAQQEITRCSY